jgi:hypothetical protein
MTRINIFKSSTFLSKFFIGFGSLLSISGILLLVNALINGFNVELLSGDWSYVLFTIQGLLLLLVGSWNLAVKKYYIEWDDDELRFLLPDIKRLDTIKIDQILAVTIRLFEIEIKLKDKTKVVDLNNLQFEDIKKIKEKFEDLRKHMSQ